MRTTTVRTGGWASGIQGARSGEFFVPAAQPSFLSLLLVNLARLAVRALRGACRHPVGFTLALGGLYVLHVGGPRALVLVAVAALVAVARPAADCLTARGARAAAAALGLWPRAT